MKIHVEGKAHLKGTSRRTGNDYDFVQVHYLGKAFGVVGQAACTLNLDPNEHPLDTIVVGADYNVEFDNRGFPVEFTPCPNR